MRLNGESAQLAVPEYLLHYPLVITDPVEDGLFKPGANGSGAFELVEAKVGERHVMRARKQYRGEGPYLNGFELVDFGDNRTFMNERVLGYEYHPTHYIFAKRLALRA